MGVPVMGWSAQTRMLVHVFIVLFLLYSEKILQSFPIKAFLFQQIQETELLNPLLLPQSQIHFIRGKFS